MISPDETRSKDQIFQQIGDAIRNHRTFAVLSHMRPDGDALGCQLAMALVLKELGKEFVVWNEDQPGDKFDFHSELQLVQLPPEEPQDFDVVLALDTATQVRLGTPLDKVRSAKLWINIDHHVSNPHYGDIAWIDPHSPATGQILFELFEHQHFPITQAVAENLYAAISTDTGSFQYPNTTARTYEIAAALVRAGVDVGKINQQIYESYPRRRLELLRELLNSAKFSANDRIASFSLTREAASRLGVTPEDNEGLIDVIRAVKSVQAAVFFEELPEGKIRISMRSKTPKIDVSEIAMAFNGGGHKLAAGARIRGSLEEIETKVLEKICNVVVN